jgi:hypothetical protein
MTDINATMAEMRSRLSHLAAVGARSARADSKIAEAAQERHADVSGEIEALRTKALTDPAAADRYQALISERGCLNLVMAQSRNR